MQLAHDYVGLADVLDDVLKQDLVEAVVLQRIRNDVEVMNDVGVSIRVQVDANGAGILLCAAAQVQDPARTAGAKRVVESEHRNGTLPTPAPDTVRALACGPQCRTTSR
jgi:hypothetical protein